MLNLHANPSPLAQRKQLPDYFRPLQGAQIFGRDEVPYRMCTQCIMDTSDPEIRFDENGVCNHCHDFEHAVATRVFPGEIGRRKMMEVVDQIKTQGADKEYDCIIGLSGGVDSSYVAYLVKQLELRPLVVHLDNGWNSESAVRNIENIVKALGFHLHTEVLDWEEFRRLQVAFLRASTPDSEIPTDHAIVTTMFRLACRERVPYIVEGSNVVTELMVPRTWSHGHSDWRYIKYLNDHFGGTRLKTYPHYTYFDHTVRFPRMVKTQRFPILDYVDFNKLEAKEVLKKELGWKDYGGKHYESIYTRFYQGYILPTKFGFDKRRSHLSCLVKDGKITRDEALAEMEKPAIPEPQLSEDRAFVIKKLGLTEDEFEAIMKAPRRTFWDYPSYEAEIPYSFARKAHRALRRGKSQLGRVRNVKGLVRRVMRRVGIGSARPTSL
ncbi:MAG: N-acetyl sugar amidotransferase [Planctomycetota bacterium]|jgi:N-acetyl sugar amidotransferase